MATPDRACPFRGPATGPPNTRDKLRSSNMLGFVSFIPLLDRLVVPPHAAALLPSNAVAAPTIVTPQPSHAGKATRGDSIIGHRVAEERRAISS